MTYLRFLHTIILLYTFSTAINNQEVSKSVLPDPSVIYSNQELDSIFNIAVFEYYYKGDYSTIVNEVPALIENAKRAHYMSVEIRFMTLLGNTLIQVGEKHSAQLMFENTLNIAKSRNDNFGILVSYMNLGNTNLYDDRDKAIEYYNEALNYKNSEGASDLQTAIIYHNLSELYLGKGNLDQSQFYIDKANQYISSPDLVMRKQEFLFNIGHIRSKILLLQGAYEDCIKSSLNTIELIEVDSKFDQNYVIDTYKTLIEAYDKTARFEDLNFYRKRYDSLKDLKYEEDKVKQQEFAKAKFNLAELEKEASNSRYQNQLAQTRVKEEQRLFWISIIVSTVLILLLASLLYARNKRNILLNNLKFKNKQYLEAKEVSEELALKNIKFLSTISHELRTPLYGIIGLSSVFLKDQELSKYSTEFNSLKFSADYLLSLVNDILNINKYESEKGQELVEEHFNLPVLMESIVKTFQFLNEKNNNQVILEISSEVPKLICGDKTKLSQVIMNLLSNASKFTQDGMINVIINQISKNKEIIELLFLIKDTGRGIKKENQEEIFEEFTQVPSTISEGGTGLGLPIVNKLLKILGSKLEMESTYGVGTEFFFNLNLKEGCAQQMSTTFETKDIKKLKNKKLLIVDDNKINQLVTQKVLEQYHMTHDTVNNGQQAVEIVNHNLYDFILMDINMPVMNGVDATIAIRKLGINTPIIALTAADDLNLEQDIFAHGIDSILVKPYHTEQLLKLLIEHL